MAPQLELSRVENTSLVSAGEPGIGTRMLNEVYVLGKGIAGTPGAIKDAAVHAYENPGSTSVQVGLSAAFGFGVGYLAGRAGAAGLIARGVATAAGLSFLDEGIKPWREAISKAWTARSDADLQAASDLLSRKLGQFTFDTALMTPGAVGGTIAGARVHARLAGRPALTAIEPVKGTALREKGAAVIESGAVKPPPAGGEVKAPELPATAPERPTRQKPYRFVQVEPGATTNKRFDFGVEISDPTLLRGQKNLDHHRTTDTAHTLSAAEQALALPDAELPRPGSVIATIRPDADSLTAMAVLANRLEGRPINRRLVEAIGRRDRGFKEPPPGENYDDLRDLIDAINHTSRSHLELHRKVFFVKDALDGSVNQELVQTLARRARDNRRSLHQNIERDMQVETIIPEKLALVKSYSSAALSHGYEYAPVVVLYNQNSHFTRFSIGTQSGSSEGRYLARALRELRELEPGWGGRSSSIFGSPQNGSTKLTPEQVVEVVRKYIDPPAYKRYWWEVVDYLRQSRPLRWFVSEG
ncbi:MAG TPA: hypothetical protein V6D08_10930 [Candidatus Obscuribacterales bacterium]